MKAIKFLDKHFEEMMCAILFVAIVALCILQVCSRYMLSSINLPWTEELARYCFIVMTYFGFSWQIQRNSIITVELLDLVLSDKGKRIQDALVYLVIFIFNIFLLFYTLQIFNKQWSGGQRLPASQWPIWIFWLVPVISCVLCLIRSIQRILKVAKGEL